MATRPKTSQTKKSQTKSQPKKPKKTVPAAQISEAAVRGDAKPAKPAPVLVNAVKPEEQFPELKAGAMGQAVDTIEKSLKAAVPAAVAVNKKLVDIAQVNMNSGLELARDLAGAKTPMEAMRLGMNYWHDHADLFQSQAQELRTLSAELLTMASEPIRAHIRRT